MLFSDQFGFRAGRSTTHAIINQLQYIYDELDTGNVVLSLFLDFKKAFDSVDHDILISKMEHYGVRGAPRAWFESYLSDRKQYSVVDGCRSGVARIRCGVPQGSCIGPLLFLVFINDLPNVSSIFKYVLFADDSTLSVSFDPKSSVNQVNIINDALDSLYNWLLANRICLNISKTRYIIFSYGLTLSVPPVRIGTATVKKCHSIKFLGVFVDAKLSFRDHVNYISSKISKTVGIIYKLSSFIDSSVLIALYKSLMCPYLVYAIEVWCSTYKSIPEKLFILQKKACRAIYKLPFNSHTTQYFADMRSLKLFDLFKFQMLVGMFKTLHMCQNNCIYLRLLTHNSCHDHITRNNHKLLLPRYRRCMSQNSFLFRAAKLWNDLPKSLHDVCSLNVFKRLMKDHYLNNY